MLELRQLASRELQASTTRRQDTELNFAVSHHCTVWDNMSGTTDVSHEQSTATSGSRLTGEDMVYVDKLTV